MLLFTPRRGPINASEDARSSDALPVDEVDSSEIDESAVQQTPVVRYHGPSSVFRPVSDKVPANITIEYLWWRLQRLQEAFDELELVVTGDGLTPRLEVPTGRALVIYRGNQPNKVQQIYGSVMPGEVVMVDEDDVERFCAANFDFHPIDIESAILHIKAARR